MRREFLKEWRIFLVVLMLILSLLWIHPNFVEGALVTVVREPASLYGVKRGDIITGVNGYPVRNASDFTRVVEGLGNSSVVSVEFLREGFPYVYSRHSVRFLPSTKANKTYLGIFVSDVPRSNLQFGLEIVGGTKVLLRPEKKLSPEEVNNVLAVLEQRLNVFGIREIPISFVQDFSGNQYFRLEFAGVSPEQVKDLLEKEGKFEARIGNETVFTGADIRSVCIGGTGCVAQVVPVQSAGGRIMWRFSFELFITQEAAERFANVTRNLDIGECSPAGCYLNETVRFFIDGEPAGEPLRISSDLKGKVVTSPAITGVRASKFEARQEMRKLQAILQSRKLPVKMTLESVEVISPALGKAFAENVFTVFLLAILGVEAIVWLRYRNWRVALPIMFITLSEILMTLGVAALIKWTLDLAGIAGLIAAVGTGVDDQIVITDEVLRGEREEKVRSIKERIKRAFFIIVVSFASTVATMVPLTFAGAGLLRGFAITTIMAVSIGIFITRPAYARLIELLMR